MEETLEYWQRCLSDFEEALISEQDNEVVNDDMIKLLKKEIEDCKEKITELE
jgi:hypothetical protein